MPSDQPTAIVSEERQKALETNVYVSADQSTQQTRLLERIADDVATIKWVVVAAALLGLLLAIQ